MAELTLRARGSDERLTWQEGRCILETEREWLLEGPAPALDAVVEGFPELAERIAANVVLLAFRSAVGKYTLPGFGEIELVSRKWTEIHFDRMLRELTEVAAALPFARRVGSGMLYERVALPDRSIPYHAFVYLRYALSEFAPAHDRFDLSVRRVLSSPHRRLIVSEHRVPVEHARNVGTRGLLRALTSPWQWSSVTDGTGGPLATALEGHLPEHMEEERRDQNVDTAENRFVSAVLDLAARIIDDTRYEVEGWTQPGVRARVLRDCERMERVLAPLRTHALWRDVGSMVVFPASSIVLQRRHGYREVLHHFVRLRLVSRIPLDERSVQDLLALKDIATLYELWAFFAVVRAVEQNLGPPNRAEELEVMQGQLAAPRGLRVAWTNGTEVLYNARFARDSDRLSTSVPLRPDVALRIPEGTNRGLHLFDAKFRLESFGGLDVEQDDDGATFKHADLYKMHAYRDAIPEAESVWILYPGTERRFFPAEASAPAGSYRGVGAIPTRPGGSDLDGVIAELIRGIPSVHRR